MHGDAKPVKVSDAVRAVVRAGRTAHRRSPVLGTNLPLSVIPGRPVIDFGDARPEQARRQARPSGSGAPPGWPAHRFDVAAAVASSCGVSLGRRAGKAGARHRPVRRRRAERAVHGQHELIVLEHAVLVRILEQRDRGRCERHVRDVFDPVLVRAIRSARDRRRRRVRPGHDRDVAVLDVIRGHRG